MQKHNCIFILLCKILVIIKKWKKLLSAEEWEENMAQMQMHGKKSFARFFFSSCLKYFLFIHFFYLKLQFFDKEMFFKVAGKFHCFWTLFGNPPSVINQSCNLWTKVLFWFYILKFWNFLCTGLYGETAKQEARFCEFFTQ